MSAATRARLAELIADEAMDLAEANLLIAAEASPAWIAAAALAEIDGLADAARAEGVVPALRVRGFRGDGEDYDDPRNSFLDQVLAAAAGPADRPGHAHAGGGPAGGAPDGGVGLPGHFVVADLSGPEPVHLDPFDDWRTLSIADLARIVRRDHRARAAARVPCTRPGAGDPGPDPRQPARLLPAPADAEDALWTVEVGLMVTPGRRGALPGDRGPARGPRALRRGGGRRRGAAGGLAPRRRPRRRSRPSWPRCATSSGG